VKITTYNINSIRARREGFAEWLADRRPDVLCLQETKAQDHQFPEELFAEAGYEVAFFGQKTYNGVAIASPHGLSAVETGVPGFDEDARGIAATVNGVRVCNVYVINGKEVGHQRWTDKLGWMAALKDWVVKDGGVDRDFVLCGDFNLCPTDEDTWDADRWHGQIFCTEQERAAFEALLALGLHDAFRETYPDAWGRYAHTWWDYRRARFPRGQGLRIDHHLVSDSLMARVEAVTIDRDARKAEKPSDHAPVELQLKD
jgi:exodeoxyribonuclease-3